MLLMKKVHSYDSSHILCKCQGGTAAFPLLVAAEEKSAIFVLLVHIEELIANL